MDIPRPELIVGAIVLLIGVALVIFVRLWQIRTFGEDAYRNMSIFASRRSSQDDAPDPLAEAEVYLAYGMKKRALEILEKALVEHPPRAELAAKLQEIKGGV